MEVRDSIDPRQFLKAQRYVVLAVIDDDGKPWAVPIAVQRYSRGAIEWVSRTDAVHSRAIARSDEVSMTVFAPKNDQGYEYGLYLRAHAKKILSMPGGLAVYRAKIYEAWYNDHKHIKTHIDLKDL